VSQDYNCHRNRPELSCSQRFYNLHTRPFHGHYMGQPVSRHSQLRTGHVAGAKFNSLHGCMSLLSTAAAFGLGRRHYSSPQWWYLRRLCFTVSSVYKLIMGDGGGGHWLIRMEWRPAGWSVYLPLLVFPCTIKSRSSLLAPAHPRGPEKGL